MPLKDYICRACGDVWEEFIATKADIPDACIHCDSDKIEVLPSAHGGYKIKGDNSASNTPATAGSFKRDKK